MSYQAYHGIIAERRVWAGSPGVELSVAAIMLPDGSTEVETRSIRHGDGRPVVEAQHRMSIGTAFSLAKSLGRVFVEASAQIETRGDRRDGNGQQYSEQRITAQDGTWMRVIAGPSDGRLVVRIDQGTGGSTGLEAATDVLLTLPFDLALARELKSAIAGAAFVAFDGQTPQESDVLPLLLGSALEAAS
jgi:hypothetical protein